MSFPKQTPVKCMGNPIIPLFLLTFRVNVAIQVRRKAVLEALQCLPAGHAGLDPAPHC